MKLFKLLAIIVLFTRLQQISAHVLTLQNNTAYEGGVQVQYSGCAQIARPFTPLQTLHIENPQSCCVVSVTVNNSYFGSMTFNAEQFAASPATGCANSFLAIEEEVKAKQDMRAVRLKLMAPNNSTPSYTEWKTHSIGFRADQEIGLN